MMSNADKRSTHTDALDSLGTIISEGEKRDAIHLAVEPVIAACHLTPGQDVGFVDGGVAPCDTPVGIVDPFLRQPVMKGERFWLVVYPRQITSLRHVWEHPAFPESGETSKTATDKEVSEQWLREFIGRSDCPDYQTVIAKALNNDSWSKEYLHFDGQDAHGEIPPEFWDHVEVVTGQKIDREARAEYFSCSC
jgi:hypothetical protein